MYLGRHETLVISRERERERERENVHAILGPVGNTTDGTKLCGSSGTRYSNWRARRW